MTEALAAHALLIRCTAATALIGVFAVLSVIDLRTRRLPNGIVLPALWAGLLLNAFDLFTGPADAILGAAAAYGTLWAIARLYALRRTGGPAFGGGDLKLAAVIGAWLGVLAVPPALLIAFVAGTVAVLPGLVTGRVRVSQTIPFGPALALGGTIVLLAGQDAVWRILTGWPG